MKRKGAGIMKKVRNIRAGAIFVIILIIVALALMYLNSYSIALMKNGFDSPRTSIIDIGIDDNGKEYRVIKSYDDQQNVKLAYLVKNKVGLWNMAIVSDTPSIETGFVKIGWMRVASIKRYGISDDTPVEFEIHAVYCGNNATKLIEIEPEELPPNVTVNVQQAGKAYTLHFIAFGEGDELSNIDVYQLLQNSGCVQ